MNRNQDNVIVITGATSGIGKITCEFLHGKGFTVYGTSRQLEARDSLPPYKFKQLDIGNTDSVNTCIKDIIKETGKIDVLINNAGYAHCGSLINLELDDMIKQYNINVFGAMRMVQAVIPFMLEKENGMIINIGSIGGRLPLPFQAAYSSSKAALMNITDSLKIELLKDGIRVCLIEPGDTQTNFHESRSYADNFDTNAVAKRSVDIMQKSEKKGMLPVMIARVIHKAILSKHPKQRYVVGPDAGLLNLINRLLPSGMRRKIVMNLYEVPEA